MIPVSLSLRNFMSYGEDVPPLDFSQFSIACLTGQNGHGKSAILDAITWALWGEARKAVGARKPDEGLLRIGASEMQVEFTFDLEGDRFRVARGWRRTGRSGRSSLELQVYQPEQDEYVTLTGSSQSETQQKINQFLRMDYQTFINSAFLLQGRADEFTQKNASERKRILSDILGLGKYDELAALAREQHNLVRDQLLQQEAELNLLQREAAQGERWQQQLQEAEDVIWAAQADLNQLEEDRERLQEEISRLQAEEARGQELARQLRQRQQEQRQLEEQLQRLTEALEHDADLLRQQAAITAEYARLQEVEALRSEMTARLQRVRQLEQEISQLTGQISAARMAMEHDLQIAAQQQRQLLAEARQLGQVMEQKEQILARQARQQQLAAALARLEKQRQQVDEISRQERQLQASVEKEEALLQAEVRNLARSLQEAERQLQQLPRLRQQQEQQQARLLELQAAGDELERVREAGSQQALLLQQLETEAERLAAEQQEVAEKLSLLGQSEAADCPLCQHPLEPERQAELAAEYRAQEQALVQAARGVTQRQEQATRERDRLRRRYLALNRQVKELPGLQQQAAAGAAAVEQLLRLQEASEQQQTQLRQLQQRLRQGDYAHAERQQLRELEEQRQQIGYDPQLQAAVEKELQEYGQLPVQLHQLQTAQRRLGEIGVEAAELAEREAGLRQQLEQGEYAAAEQERRRALQAALEAVAYDGQQHRALDEEWTRLQPGGQRYRQLLVAQERAASLNQQLNAGRARQAALAAEIGRLQQEIQTLQTALQELEPLRQRLQQIGAELDAIRRRQQQAIGRKVEAESGLLRSRQAQARQEVLQQQAAQLQRERRIYERLTVAFGKDGIPALIIENAIPEIEELANEILERLSGGKARVTIEPLRDKKSGGTKETLEIKISDEMGTRDYELFSGGEAFRTDFAIRIALSKLLARRAGTRLQTLVIDEGFGTQDAEGLQNMVEAIQAVREDFEKILVVTHLDALRDAFPVRIEVTKYPEVGSRWRIVHL